MIQFIRFLSLTFLLLTQAVFAVERIDSQSGLIVDKGYQEVKKNCSSCHSLTLVIQNKASRKGWLEMLRWMQKTQGMAMLKEQEEEVILSYLSKNYAVKKISRRRPLRIEKWHRY